jgi:tetratricopeptide (TPR) repeat protein
VRANPELLLRQAESLQHAGLYPTATAMADSARRAAAAVADRVGVVEASARLMSIALDRGQPELAMGTGNGVLPLVLGGGASPPDLRARVFILLAKASWELGHDHDLAAFVDAARSELVSGGVSEVVRLHYALVAGAAALDAGDGEAAKAHWQEGLALARAMGHTRGEDWARQNLLHGLVRLGEFDAARRLLPRALRAAPAGGERLDLYMDAIHLALGLGDVAAAGAWARRLVAGYCASPSRLSPITMGYLFEALGACYADLGNREACGWLWGQASQWFGLRHRARDQARVAGRLARYRPPRSVTGGPVDPDLLYLGRLFAAAERSSRGVRVKSLAMTVHALLPAVAPQAGREPTEHAALLAALAPEERGFAGRSLHGRAAEDVLAGRDEPSRRALDVLAAYERLTELGAGWGRTITWMRRARLPDGPVDALDRLYRSVVA